MADAQDIRKKVAKLLSQTARESNFVCLPKTDEALIKDLQHALCQKNNHITNAPFPVENQQQTAREILPVEDQQQTAREILPVEDQQQTAREILPVEDQQQTAREILPVENQQQTAREILPVEDQQQTAREILPVENQQQTAREILPVVEHSALSSISLTQWQQKIDAIEDWSTLQKLCCQCVQCGLCEGRTKTVFGDGHQRAEIVFIGEGPGKNEDEQGLPFVGRAGRLLTQMILSLQMQRKDVYITNVVKCRPPNNRAPVSDEILACRPFLDKQIAWIKPKLIVAVGSTALKLLKPEAPPISQARQSLMTYRAFPMVAIYHPAYLLRNRTKLSDAIADMRFVSTTFTSMKK